MSTELPWSTRVFITAKFSISTVMTIGSSWVGSIPLISASIKVMEGILLCKGVVTTFTTCTALRCFFLVIVVDPPLANPSTMVLMTPLRVESCGLRWASLSIYCRQTGLSSARALSWFSREPLFYGVLSLCLEVFTNHFGCSA